MTIKLKRIYDSISDQDGIRVLVDRVWPRGVAKAKADLDDWLKEIGPSTELRKWFGHDPDKYEQFKQKYKDELRSGEQLEAFEKLAAIVKNNDIVTLVYGAKDEEHNQARVLKELLEKEN